MPAMDHIDDLRERLRRAASVNEIAELAECDRSTVMRVRDGKNTPNMGTFQRLLKAAKAATKRKRVG